jgi:hypothetical protein
MGLVGMLRWGRWRRGVEERDLAQASFNLMWLPCSL